MKNACLVLTTEKAFPCVAYADVLAAFARGGYFFLETRVISVAEETAVKAALIDLKNAYENIALIACGVSLSAVRRFLEDVFQRNYERDTVLGEGVYTQDRKTLFLLSADDKKTGVSYVESVCVPHMNDKYVIRKDSIVVRCVGADERWLQGILAQAEEMGDGKLTVVRTGRFGEDVIRVFYDSSTPKMLIDDVLRFLVDRLNENIYALDDTPLEVRLVQLLRLRGRKISVAESFTGGGLGKRIVSVSGASAVYFEGLNTYAETSKIQRLGVTEYTLRTQGAVSEQTAYEMAAGLLATGNCQVAISTTGLAGPNGDDSGLPVGICCIGVGIEDKVYVYRYRLDGDREAITQTAINYALFLACKQMKNL